MRTRRFRCGNAWAGVRLYAVSRTERGCCGRGPLPRPSLFMEGSKRLKTVRKVIVTGGAGFIGSAFIWKLNREGIDGILVVDRLGTGDKWKNLVGLRFEDWIHKDAFSRMIVEDRVPFDADAVVHMGACSSTTERDADYLLENNTRFTRRLCDWALARGARFLYASSAATYGGGEAGFSDRADLERLRPLNMYGQSKHLFDLHAHRNGLFDRIAGVKFFNVFGPNEYHKGEMASVVFKAFHQVKETGRMRLFRSHRPDFADGGQVRDFVYVKDCVEVLWWLLCHGEANGLFNLGTGRGRSFNDLASALFCAMGMPVSVDYIPMPEALRGKYQYFTEARMEGLAGAGCPLAFRSLEEAVADYVSLHLEAEVPHLRL